MRGTPFRIPIPPTAPNRRTFVRAGGISFFGGFTLPNLLQGAERASPVKSPKIKSVILFNLLGGPSHIDMFDMKPDAPEGIRGEFGSIETSLPGLRICELLPNTARLMHKTCLIRTISHTYDSHDPMAIMTGFTGGNPQLQAQPTDPPDIGAICQYVGLGPQDVPGAVCLPCYPGWGQNGYRRGGPYGGFLGSRYDPLFSLCDPKFSREPKIRDYEPVLPVGVPFLADMDAESQFDETRIAARKTLLDTFAARSDDDPLANLPIDRFQRKAFDLLTARKTREAFDLNREPEHVRDRYGRNLFGSSLLVARRLVEAGVPFVSVHQDIFLHYGHSYDMHARNFPMLKDFNLPILDRVYPALIHDLESRGLLDSTLVIVMGEMGRSPRVNKAGGRDHWPKCGFSLLTGGGIRPGTVYGTSDKIGAYPTVDPVHPSDLVATIYRLLGIDPGLEIHDRLGRPFTVAQGGVPIAGILA